ncbi:MAG: flagellar hook assembly protein FlgD [Aquabacterium sp.]|uniref:flagellar hook assembly protein FlgD n=1 Tax=Aquabacterium sp. TaxID=1872578 RepID=UPI001210A712|nr:flagellar hook capping FlgD N-terminal domain-containing protein [Aquabacterium sp.]TAK96289.1 MAG: flagellar hook assembly protein FlgD [Aquabacterium sp.]
MTTVTNNTATSSTSSTSSSTTSTTGANSMTEASDRFLKLLVTQMQNQDPLNPADNSQITSQMAQINTVTGIDKLNTTMTSFSTNMTQMQMLQGASLVGHQVVMNGNQLFVGSDGKTSAGYNLAGAATTVQIDILDAAGNKLDTISQSGVAAGDQGFQWTPPSGTSTNGLTFKVTATGGNGKAITATPLMSDLVDAVSASNGTLNLELRNAGTTAYSKIKSVS